jgi:hypothetical protein
MASGRPEFYPRRLWGCNGNIYTPLTMETRQLGWQFNAHKKTRHDFTSELGQGGMQNSQRAISIIGDFSGKLDGIVPSLPPAQKKCPPSTSCANCGNGAVAGKKRLSAGAVAKAIKNPPGTRSYPTG